MRIASVILLAATAAATVAAGAGARTERESANPTLRVVSWSPLKLRGTSFERRERVRVVVRGDGRRLVRRLRTTRTGAFTAVFAATTVFDRCGFSAVAIGSRGSRASFKLPLTACPPPLSP